MELLLLLLVFPLVWPWIARYKWQAAITWEEMTLNIVICVALTAGIWYVGVFTKASDIEILNGEVVGKARERVSCEHSYSCNCRSERYCDSDGNNCSTTEACDTCYEHSYDYDWVVHSNAGDFRINRVDRQGVSEPPRFSVVQKSQPVALAHQFVNYIKAAPESLFNKRSSVVEGFAGQLPDYPDQPYDYHYVNRVIPVGVAVPDLASWNFDLALLLRELGPAKQANVVIVFTKFDDPMYARALEAHWLGGKKNDIIVIIGTPEYPKIAWADVVSWTDNELFKVELKDALFQTGTVDRAKVFALVRTHTLKSFTRKPMSEFSYLKYEIDPPLWAMILAIIVAIGGSIGLSWYFHREDVRIFGGRSPRTWR